MIVRAVGFILDKFYIDCGHGLQNRAIELVKGISERSGVVTCADDLDRQSSTKRATSLILFFIFIIYKVIFLNVFETQSQL